MDHSTSALATSYVRQTKRVALFAMNRKADDEAKREDRIHQRFAELRRLGVLMIDVDGCRVIGECREQDIVHVGHRPPDFMNKRLPDGKLFEIESSHLYSSLNHSAICLATER